MHTHPNENRPAQTCHLPDLNLEYWQRILHPAISGIHTEKLPGGNSPSRITRIHLLSAGHGTVICKESRAPWPATDPGGLHREYTVYQNELAHLPPIGPALIHSEQTPCGNRLILADLEPEYRFRPAAHTWTHEDIRPALQILALLHIASATLPLASRDLLIPAPDSRWPTDAVRDAAVALSAVSDNLYPVADRLLNHLADQRKTWQGRPRVLLHSDFNPLNIAFSRSKNPTARLIDWHIAASGMAAFETASLFYQPYHNHRRLDRRTLLNDYLTARHALDGISIRQEEEWAAFCYATAWCGLSYLPPAARTFHRFGNLPGWWSNLLVSILENLTWCAGSIP